MLNSALNWPADNMISLNQCFYCGDDIVYLFRFIKKFNNTFGNLMTEQKTLISKYMGSLEDDDTELKIFVNEELERLKEELKKSKAKKRQKKKEVVKEETTE